MIDPLLPSAGNTINYPSIHRCNFLLKGHVTCQHHTGLTNIFAGEFHVKILQLIFYHFIEIKQFHENFFFIGLHKIRKHSSQAQVDKTSLLYVGLTGFGVIEKI